MIIKGEEVEFLSAGTVMGAEMIDPMAQHMLECRKCGGLKYPSAFTPSQINLSHPQCRACRISTERKRKIGGAGSEISFNQFMEWEVRVK